MCHLNLKTYSPLLFVPINHFMFSYDSYFLSSRFASAAATLPFHTRSSFFHFTVYRKICYMDNIQPGTGLTDWATCLLRDNFHADLGNIFDNTASEVEEYLYKSLDLTNSMFWLWSQLIHHLYIQQDMSIMDSPAARMAMVSDSPNPSLRSRTTVTTECDSCISTISVTCSHFLSTNFISVGKWFPLLPEINLCLLDMLVVEQLPIHVFPGHTLSVYQRVLPLSPAYYTAVIMAAEIWNS